MTSQVAESKIAKFDQRRIKNWLDKNIKTEKTKSSYYVALKSWLIFKYGKESVTDYSTSQGGRFRFSGEKIKRNSENRILEIEDGIERYLNESDGGDFIDEVKGYIHWLRDENYAGLTIRDRVSIIRKFFRRQDAKYKIIEEELDQIRILLPRSTRAATQDDILTKDQLKILSQHMSIHLKAMFLFLLSSGIRIGAACQLVMEDLHLDADPPWVNVREEYTKAEVGGRRMWLSYEARDAIIEWHKIRKGIKKRGGFGDYDENLVFNYNHNRYRIAFNHALKKADGVYKKSDEENIQPVFARRDPSTKLKIHVFHNHTLRKFFSTNMRLKGSHEGYTGVPERVVEAWMGHKGYLDQYTVFGLEGMANIYAENMQVVTIYEVGIPAEARAKYQKIIDDAQKVEDKSEEQKIFVLMFGGLIGAFEDMTDDEKKSLSLDELNELVLIKAATTKDKNLYDLNESRDATIRALRGQVSNIKEVLDILEKPKA